MKWFLGLFVNRKLVQTKMWRRNYWSFLRDAYGQPCGGFSVTTETCSLSHAATLFFFCQDRNVKADSASAESVQSYRSCNNGFPLTRIFWYEWPVFRWRVATTSLFCHFEKKTSSWCHSCNNANELRDAIWAIQNIYQKSRHTWCFILSSWSLWGPVRDFGSGGSDRPLPRSFIDSNDSNIRRAADFWPTAVVSNSWYAQIPRGF